jgi:hypothetical protein
MRYLEGYSLWIQRETHRGEFVGLVVLNPPSIKLRVTCVHVLLVVAICPSFLSGSLKTMILMNGYWSILSARWMCYERLIFNLIPRIEFNFPVGKEKTIIAYDMDRIKVHVIPAFVIRYGRCRVLTEDMSRSYYLPYVPLFLESLGEQ